MAVFTQPDRPKGRGQKESMPPVKEAALRLGLPIFQPERVRVPDVVTQLAALKPDAMIVVGYGQLIPQSILDIPPAGIINVHASLLPKYRGAAPIQWAIARGETRTGVTTMRINAGLDTGDMLLKWETDIGTDETSVELGPRLATAGARLLIDTLASLSTIQPEPQDHSQATWAPVINKEDGRIDWSMSASEIINRMRGFTPWPGCYGFLKGQRFHVWKAKPMDRALPQGALRIDGKKLFAGCGQGSLELLEVQLEGRKRMDTSAFLNGLSLEANEVLQ
jgi:methionyl-tRNA formyltransferase